MIKNKVEIKKFFGTDVRVVNKDWLVVKDMFGALGRLTTLNQVEHTDNVKLDNIIELLGLCAYESFIISSKTAKAKSRETQDVRCIKINDCPVILTQFKPTARAGEETLKTWVEFMKFVNNLLVAHNVDMFDIVDRRNQLTAQERLDSENGKVVVMNNMLSQMLAELCGVDGKILKRDIRKFQEERPDIRLDLGLIYEEMREDFVNAFSFTQSHSNAKEMVLKKTKRKYNID